MGRCPGPDELRVHVSASPADGELARLIERVADSRPIEQLAGLRHLLDRLHRCRRCAPRAGRRTLDLLAHATPDRLLQLGTTVLDPRRPGVRRVFEEMARDAVLPRLGIRELRLLGCETAMSRAGQAAIRALTEILGVRVVGTTRPVYAAYFGASGLGARYEAMLCDADCLPDLRARRALPGRGGSSRAPSRQASAGPQITAGRGLTRR